MEDEIVLALACRRACAAAAAAAAALAAARSVAAHVFLVAGMHDLARRRRGRGRTTGSVMSLLGHADVLALLDVADAAAVDARLHRVRICSL